MSMIFTGILWNEIFSKNNRNLLWNRILPSGSRDIRKLSHRSSVQIFPS